MALHGQAMALHERETLLKAGQDGDTSALEEFFRIHKEFEEIALYQRNEQALAPAIEETREHFAGSRIFVIGGKLHFSDDAKLHERLGAVQYVVINVEIPQTRTPKQPDPKQPDKERASASILASSSKILSETNGMGKGIFDRNIREIPGNSKRK
jgi:hypothetical protein